MYFLQLAVLMLYSLAHYFHLRYILKPVQTLRKNTFLEITHAFLIVVFQGGISMLPHNKALRQGAILS